MKISPNNGVPVSLTATHFKPGTTKGSDRPWEIKRPLCPCFGGLQTLPPVPICYLLKIAHGKKMTEIHRQECFKHVAPRNLYVIRHLECVNYLAGATVDSQRRNTHDWTYSVMTTPKFSPNVSILTWRRGSFDHEGSSPRSRPFHCTSVWLKPAIPPNVGNSGV